MLSSTALHRSAHNRLRIALLGYGTINYEVAKAITSGLLPNVRLVSVLTRSKVTCEQKRDLMNEYHLKHFGLGVNFCSDEEENVNDFFEDSNENRWDLCVEAAGQPAVRSYGQQILKNPNRRFLVTSIGAMADDSVWTNLCLLASSDSFGGPRLLLCSGAMPALDWISAATTAQNDALDSSCTVTQIKPPISWKSTPAEESQLQKQQPLESLTEFTILFEGTARQAATLFPKNSNVACTLALANGLGLDRTKVQLATDPRMSTKGGCRLEYKQEGVRSIKIDVEEYMSPENPKTSKIVPLSVIKALRNLSEKVVVGFDLIRKI